MPFCRRDVGQHMIQKCDSICFTGSVATGRKVAAAAAANMIPCFLELGGKDAAVVVKELTQTAQQQYCVEW